MNATMIDKMFLQIFPLGLNDDHFTQLAKKHKSSDKILEMVKQIDLKQFDSDSPTVIRQNIATITKLVTKSTMISTFEKLAFKNYMQNASYHALFLKSLKELIMHNNEDQFNDFVDVLSLQKNEYNANIAKWPIISFFLLYFNPNQEVLVKPTTIKKLAHFLNYEIDYKPLPNFHTYALIRDMVMAYKRQSKICAEQNNITVQAIMYCVIS